ncbi:MAG: virulence factor SrfC family protein [Succinivibrio sp.]
MIFDLINNQLDKTAVAACEAVRWFDEVDDEKINRVKDDIEVTLCDLANLSESAYEVLPVTTTIGVFGPSQVGKSHLVSTLSCPEKGKTISATMDGHKISFIKHFNPTGQGDESTGLVTRFTHNSEKQVKGYPVSIKLFTETEIVKILINACYEDFVSDASWNAQVDAFFESEDKIKAFFDELESQEFLCTDGSNYIRECDVVSLARYANSHCREVVLSKSSYTPSKLFWKKARKILPKLNFKGRSKVYSKLWNGIKVLDRIFEILGTEAVLLKGKRHAHVELKAFVTDDGQGGLRQRNDGCLIDVRALQGLYAPKTDENTVKVCLDSSGDDIAEIQYSALAALTVEVVFPIEGNSDGFVFDVLDFPGCRSRGGKFHNAWQDNDGTMGNVDSTSKTDFVIRGKVGYLIEHYCDRKEIDLLLLCSASKGNQEVTEIIECVNTWVHGNIGKTPEERAKLTKIPLIGAFTKFDATIMSGFTSEAKGNEGIDRAITKALEKLKNAEWIKEWSDGKHFKQFFFVRRPNIPECNMYEMDENSIECRLKDDVVPQVNKYLSEIVKDPEMRFVYEFDEKRENSRTIKAVLQENDGGLELLMEFISQNFTDYIEGKRKVLKEIELKAEAILEKLRVYAGHFASVSTDKIRREAVTMVSKLKQLEDVAGTLTDIRDFTEIDCDKAISDYLNNRSEVSDNAYRFAKALGQMREDNLDSICHGVFFNELFANLKRCWDEKEQENVRKYDDEKKLKERSFFLDDKGEIVTADSKLRAKLYDLLEKYVTELKKAYRSLKVEDALIEILKEGEKVLTTKDRSAELQCGRALKLISDFNTLLYVGRLKDDSIERYEIETEKRCLYKENIKPEKGFMLIPNLGNDFASEFENHYYNDYFSVLIDVITVKNQSADSEFNITTEQGMRLGELLKQIEETTQGKANE